MNLLKLNNSFRKWLRNKNFLYPLESIQIASGVFGILYGIVFTLYFYVKINKTLSFIFLLPIILGLFLINSTKRDILNDEERGNEFPI